MIEFGQWRSRFGYMLYERGQYQKKLYQVAYLNTYSLAFGVIDIPEHHERPCDVVLTVIKFVPTCCIGGISSFVWPFRLAPVYQRTPRLVVWENQY